MAQDMSEVRKKIAILGATSNIAKSLILNYYEDPDAELFLFTTSMVALNSFLSNNLSDSGKNHKHNQYDGYDGFRGNMYDVIINCIGPGTLRDGKGCYTDYFTLTEKFDNLVIEHLCRDNGDALYICFSSGAIYGRELSSPATVDSVNGIVVNKIMPIDYHSIARLNSESKHRAYDWLNIVDFRIFSYFSRYSQLSDGYFITELVDCITKNKIFITDHNDMSRDYIHPSDLLQIINKCISIRNINNKFDAISLKYTTKYEILARFSEKYGLKYEFCDSSINSGATGHKKMYCSSCNCASAIGYNPRYTSIDSLLTEAGYLLSRIKV